MLSKEYSHHKEKWLSKKTLFEAENNEIILKRKLYRLKSSKRN